MNSVVTHGSCWGWGEARNVLKRWLSAVQRNITADNFCFRIELPRKSTNLPWQGGMGLRERGGAVRAVAFVSDFAPDTNSSCLNKPAGGNVKANCGGTNSLCTGEDLSEQLVQPLIFHAWRRCGRPVCIGQRPHLLPLPFSTLKIVSLPFKTPVSLLTLAVT